MYLVKHIKHDAVRYLGACHSNVKFNCKCKDDQDDECDRDLVFYISLSDWSCEKYLDGIDTILECVDNVAIDYTGDSIYLGTFSEGGCSISLNIRNFANVNDSEFEDMYDVNSFITALEEYFGYIKSTIKVPVKSSVAEDKATFKSGLDILKATTKTILD